MDATPSRVRCRVCGSGEVHTDEAFDRRLWLLAECRRCEYRWTRSEACAPPQRQPARVRAGSGARPLVAPAA